MKCANGTASGWASEFHNDPHSSESLKISAEMRPGDKDKYRMFALMDAIGGYGGGGNQVNVAYFDDSANIKIWDGAVLTDTGFNYDQNTWQKIEFLMNYTANTCDVWVEGVLVADDYDFRNGANSVESISVLSHNGGGTTWWDDFDLPTEVSGWSGNFNGRLNPPNLNGRVKSEVLKANGVQSA